MDQKRLMLAIALSLGILLVFQFAVERFLPHPPPSPTQTVQQAGNAGTPQGVGASPAGAPTAPVGPRLAINAPRISGSIGLTGAVFDDVVLKDYHETIAKDSPLVQLLGRPGSAKPSYAQFGWTAVGNIKVPTDATVWTPSGNTLTPQSPVTLSWDNGAGLTFQLMLSVDDNYMFTVSQLVINHTGAPVQLFPWSRVVRDYKPVEQSSYILYDGPLGVFNNTLHQQSYNSIKSGGEHSAGGQAYSETSPGGWIGITDKYWLTALAPAQSAKLTGSMSYGTVTDGDGSAYQTSFITAAPLTIAAGATGSLQTHLFTGAKVVRLLDAYGREYGIPSFDKSVDFGYLYFITKPIFFCLDWLNSLTGNFGLAILIFTVGVKLLFFPLASYSYRSMGRMKLVQPKIQAIRERLKDEPAKQQQEIMALYKSEKINPASGCLPMVVQIPVFFSLYKVIYTTIEMRQAPFYGWIHDLSVPDPTNLFNLFGLIPFDPTTISPLLHLGGLPIIMGITMFLQQRLNPAPPDPVQARMFQFMPIIFTFVLARSPAGLVLYWAWNNLLSVGQQWLIMRQAGTPRRTALAKAKG
ncbi:membrane protein insertase YidC [Acidocella sp.]|jgi:YidC/Oxa1 family membrane protein insertase|uniref:membrane protein insertase YidC n=1 Tax=Acidocella sp. TaxID=50710 RepID=UPI002F425D7B